MDASIDDYKCGVTLGTGSFGRVKFATAKSDGQCFAIKILKKTEIIKLQQVEHMKSEKSILQEISEEKHPFIVNLETSFQDKGYIYMVLDFIPGGEFFTYLRDAEFFDNDSTQFYAAHIVLIFEYLHKKDVIYRDLKPENLLLDRTGYLKLADFGFAKRVTFKTYTLCGTPEYIAPEILLNKGHGKGVDWWTFGIFIYEMIYGEPPFVDDDPMEIYKQILTAKVPFGRGVDRNAKSLIKRLLTPNLTKRYGCMKNGASDIKKCKWFNGFDWEKFYNRELVARIVPDLNGQNDTSNFEQYPESDDNPADFLEIQDDPFFESF